MATDLTQGAAPIDRDLRPAMSAHALMRAALWLAGIVVAAALFSRIMSFSVRHDEQFYVPAGILFTPGGLYQDFGFNHLPNLPILLSAVFGISGTDHYLLAGRLVVVAFWLLGAVMLALLARRLTNSVAVAVFAVGLYVTNPILLGQAGMAVTNNFLPIPVALAGLYFFLRGTEDGWPRFWFLFASGFAVAVAMGFKANYAFLAPCFAIAALFMPAGLSPSDRVQRVLLPFLAGALLGGLPTLAYLAADPDGFLAHVVRYHRDAQIEYWSANTDLDGEKALGLGQKIKLAHSLWVLGAGGLIPLAIIFLLSLLLVRAGWRGALKRRGTAALILVFALFLLGAAISFAPTPSFPQYYAPPIVFGIVAMMLLYAKLDGAERAIANPFIVATTLFLALAGGPQLFADVGSLARPHKWAGLAVHREGARLAAATAGHKGPIATLAPLYVLEGGRTLYPELQGGFVTYRVGDMLRRNEARHYRYLASPTTIGSVLERSPPAGILVGMEEGTIEQPLIDYARQHGYSGIAQPVSDRRGRETTLYVPPATAASGPARP